MVSRQTEAYTRQVARGHSLRNTHPHSPTPPARKQSLRFTEGGGEKQRYFLLYLLRVDLG